MDTNETTDTYTAGDFGKDVAKSAVFAVAQTVIAMALLLTVSAAADFVVKKVAARKARKTLTEN